MSTSQIPQNLKIYRFCATGIGGLEVVQLEFDENLNLITGRNGAGKSSLINSIMQTFTGVPVLREGSEQGEAVAEIGGNGQKFQIKRVLKDGKTPKLEIRTGENFDFTVDSPAQFLKKLVGGKDIAISPTMFINVKGGGKARKEVLMNAVGIDTSEIDQKIQQIKFKRSEVKRRVDHARLELQSDPIVIDMSADEVSVADLVNRLEKANEHNRGIERANDALDISQIDFSEDLEKLQLNEAEIKAQELRLKEMREQAEIRKQQLEQQKANLEAEESRIREMRVTNTEAIQTEINQAESTNTAIRRNNEKKTMQVRMDNDQAEYSELYQQMKKLEGEKQSDLDSRLPIPGISIGEDDVYWKNGNGSPVPGEQWSTAEAIYIGCAVRVAQGDSSGLKTVFVDDISLLDPETLAKLRDLLGDYQIFEVHNALIGKTDGLNVITIEEGKVAA